MKNKLTALRILSIFFMWFIATSCGKESSETGVEIGNDSSQESNILLTEAQFEAMKMEWGSINTKEFSEEIQVQGMVKVPVEGMQEVGVYFGGFVSGLELLEGQQVRRGEVLFYMENLEFVQLQQSYLEAKSQVNYLKMEYERQKTLYSEQIASQKNYMKAEAEYQSNLAKMESLKRQLGLLKINTEKLTAESIRSKIAVYSPINGFVTNIHAVPGAFLQATDIAVSLISKEHLHMELMVFEKDASYIRKGQKVKVRIPEISQEELIAQVFMVGQSISEERQINVHADLEDESKESLLIPGMFIEAKIQKDPQSGISIPQSAVVESDGESFVLVLRAKTESGYSLEKIRVETGRINFGEIEILPNSQLKESDQILIKGGFNLL